MSFGAAADSFFGDGEDELAFETRATNSLLTVQTRIRLLEDQSAQLLQERPTQKAVSIVKSLIDESSSALASLETQFKQRESTVGGDLGASSRRKLIIPHLKASFQSECEKLKRVQKLVEAAEKQSTYNPSVATGWTDLPLDHFGANKEQQLVDTTGWSTAETTSASLTSLPAVNYSAPPPRRVNVQSPSERHTTTTAEYPPLHPTLVGGDFYDRADDGDHFDTLAVTKRAVSSSSTHTGGSGSPCSEEGRSCSMSAISSNDSAPEVTPENRRRPLTPHSRSPAIRDDFLEDNYSRQNRLNISEVEFGDEDDEELSGLLTRGSARSASYLDDWHLSVDQARQDDDLELYVSRERLQGVRRMKAQLSQISSVFRELSHLINEQQDDLDSIDSHIQSVKGSTGMGVDELRKANALKQRARRRNLVLIVTAILILAGILAIHWLSLPSGNAPLPATIQTAVGRSPPVVAAPEVSIEKVTQPRPSKMNKQKAKSSRDDLVKKQEEGPKK